MSCCMLQVLYNTICAGSTAHAATRCEVVVAIGGCLLLCECPDFVGVCAEAIHLGRRINSKVHVVMPWIRVNWVFDASS